MFIDGLQYCNWSKKIFEDWRSANLTAVHVTIFYHEQFYLFVKRYEINPCFICYIELTFEQTNTHVEPGYRY